ncbi:MULTISPECIES: carbohydrate kinase family protein [unclassified Aureimonas]|uniref:carbohydrate kinase family protein n=1 Tax=unclassified Aureimonas TaxID=2615206 RepID=UPI0006FEE73E|nr:MULTISPECIES: carbohydrate kinase [unclassified Aureimonas]KQT61221.1 hypothetical protein ASG54_24070 [Aureimonas sp. Leaf460]KQT68670.1 hypothetical protein ASG62_18830 [Aureimonas sp. Leaf427]
MILTCGDALIDMVPVRRPGEPPSYRPMAGGSCLNIAVALARLGTPAGFVGGISTDFLGDILRDTLTAEGVDLSRATFLDEESTLGLVSLESGSARYVFYDQASASRHWAPSEQALDFADVSAVHFGSVTLIGDPAGARCEAYAAKARRHCLVTLDPNCRPTLVRDPAAYRARIDRMAQLSDIVRLSDEDAAYLYPDTPLDAVASLILDKGARLVVLTRGAAGAAAATRSASAHVPAVAVAVEDTIGAGDSFFAAFLTALSDLGSLDRAAVEYLSPADIEIALRFAARAASLACTKTGANPPYRRELAARVSEMS